MYPTKWIHNAWYIALYADAVTIGETARRVVLNQALVLYRTSSGEVVALEDRCPHRSAPLSMGRVRNGDQLACAYHGLAFDGTGRCVHNPHGGRIPAAATVRSYPAEEKYGAVWVWMADPLKKEPLPTIDFLEESAGYRLSKPDVLKMETPWDLIIDNLVDLSHVSFLHDGLLGTEEMIGAKNVVTQNGNSITVTRETPGVRPPEYSDLLFHADGQPVDKFHNVTWIAPSIILLDIRATEIGASREAGTGVYAAHIITPETDDTAHYYFMAARWNPVERSEADNRRIEARLAEVRRIAFAEQDEPMIRAQYGVIRRHGGTYKPVMLEIDAGIVRWRRILDRLVDEERAPAVRQSA